jgi:hypothetical protein
MRKAITIILASVGFFLGYRLCVKKANKKGARS